MEVDLASAGLVAIEIISAGLGNPSNDFEVDNNISSFIKEELANQIGKEHLVLCSKLLNKILDDDSNDFMTLGGKR